MSNRMRLRNRKASGPEPQFLAWLYQFDGRRAVSHYGSDELELQVVSDAVAGFDQGAEIGNVAITWWIYEATIRIAKLRHKSVEDTFQTITAKVSAVLGRPWP